MIAVAWFRVVQVVVVAALTTVSANAQVRYVDASAPPGGTGLTWATAFSRLQDALAVVGPGSELRVAQGTYTPADAGGSRAASFTVAVNLTLRGGYAGLAGADPNARDVTLYRTMLSGDLSGDDAPGFMNRGDNVYHVLTVTNRSSSTVIDGVTVRGGNADTAGDSLFGGGVFGRSTAAVFIDCAFEDNSAYRAGGMFLTTTNSGIGAPRLRGCRFVGNRATDSYSGAAYITNSATRIPLSMSNCVFVDNEAFLYSGGFFIDNYDVTMLNCLVAGNRAVGTATSTAGGAQINNGVTTIINSTFADNVAAPGWTGGLIVISVGFPTITNCVLWNNTGAQLTSSLVPTITYSDIQGGVVGGGNINADPLFRNPAVRDYRPSPGSPLINAGNTFAFLAPAQPLGLVSDASGGPRFLSPPDAPTPGTGVGGPPIIDIGAYEYAGPTTCVGDINGDGVVNFIDLNLLLNAYGMTCPP